MELYALGIAQVRDIFGADARLADELREVASTTFPAPTRRPGAFRPLMRRDRSFAVDPDRPQQADVEALLSGEFIAPERAPACWHLVEAFVSHLSRAHLTVLRDAALLDRVEFDLARGGLSSRFALRRLAELPLQIPLRPLPGQLVGYAKRLHARETAVALDDVLTSPIDDQSALTEETRRFVTPVATFLTGLAEDEDVIVIGHQA